MNYIMRRKVLPQKKSRPFSNTRREPCDLEHFRRMYAGSLNESISIKRKPAEVVQKIHTLLGPTIRDGGKGAHFLFPLTGALATGEFVKGMLKVIAPQARVSFLVTPKNYYLMKNRLNDPKLQVVIDKSKENLAQHFNRCVRPSCERIIVIDWFDRGSTLNAIRAAARENPLTENAPIEFQTAQDFTSFTEQFVVRPHPLGWKKTSDGRFAADSANVLKAENFTGYIWHGHQKQTNFYRRLYYNLGLATARAYLTEQKQGK